MSGLQFLLAEAVERGASLNEARVRVGDWAARHPDQDLLEHRTYKEWRRTFGATPENLASHPARGPDDKGGNGAPPNEKRKARMACLPSPPATVHSVSP